MLKPSPAGFLTCLLPEVGRNVCQGNALLAGGVPVSDGDGAVIQGVRINGEAEWRADLVLPTVALPDVGGLIVVDQMWRLVLKALEEFPGDAGKLRLLHQRQDC